jgi:hypothetical protein
MRLTTPVVDADLFASADNTALCSLSFVMTFAAGSQYCGCIYIRM